MKRIIDVSSFWTESNVSFHVGSIHETDNSDSYKPTHILNFLRELRYDGVGSDVTIEVGRTSYPLHKTILRRSQYFSNLFDEFGDQKSFSLDVLMKGSFAVIECSV